VLARSLAQKYGEFLHSVAAGQLARWRAGALACETSVPTASGSHLCTWLMQLNFECWIVLIWGSVSYMNQLLLSSLLADVT
jgi:hypothetical protein